MPLMPKFVQAKSFYRGGNAPTIIVIHDMEYPEKPGGAEWCADFFASGQVQASAHYCLAPETRVLCDDLAWRPIGDLEAGQGLVSTEEHAEGMGGRTLLPATITRTKRREAECLRVTFDDGREVVCSVDHRWLVKPPLGGAPWTWQAAESLVKGSRLLAPLRPWEQRIDRDAGYVEGIFDGEGCWASPGDLSFAQKRGGVLDRAKAILARGGIAFREHHREDSGVTVVTLSGLQATLQALGQFNPRRLAREPRWVGRALRSRTHSNSVAVASIERLGVREVVSIETSTHTFFAEGIVSHNCVDNDSIVQCVKDTDGAWHTPGSLPAKGGREINRTSIGIEHAGFAKQTEAEWQDDYSRAMLEQSAELTATLCVRFSIPAVKLSPQDLIDGKRGVCGHVDCTKATGVGTHWDPGPGFPWDWYMARVRAHEALLQASVSEVIVVDAVPVELSDWPIVTAEGVRYHVAPIYITPIGIGQAQDMARELGCELPSKALVDAIWRASDLKLTPFQRSPEAGTLKDWGASMSSLETFNDQARRLEGAIAGRSFKLLSGVCKDVVLEGGVLGIYGGHRPDGSIIQPFYSKHARGWIDYLQGLRLVRRV